MKTMKNEDSELLMSESVRLTQELRALQGEMARCGKERRDIWQELNDRGISQKRLALASDVVEHTVYTELRKRRSGRTRSQRESDQRLAKKRHN